MFIVPLDAAQQAKEVAPQVWVAVQQPAGMPEWVGILLSAAVGAVFAIVAGLLTEYVKPRIQRGQVRRRMIEQLNDELLKNMASIEGAYQMLELELPKEKPRAQMAGVMLSLIKSDRFDHFFSEVKTLLYEYDQELIALYTTVRQTLPGVLVRDSPQDIQTIIEYVGRLARGYIIPVSYTHLFM